jgi:hypothetical protein
MVATTYRATTIVCAVLSLAAVLGERTVNAQTPPASAGPHALNPPAYARAWELWKKKAMGQ